MDGIEPNTPDKPPYNHRPTHIAGLCATALLGVLTWTLPGAATASPLPYFPDPAMQRCMSELATTNNWLQAEDVDRIVCVDRGIETIDGVQALVNLNALDLHDNRLFDLNPLALPKGLTELNLSNNVRLTLVQIQGILGNNQGLTRLGLDGIAIEHFYQLPLYSINGPYALTELSLRNTGMLDLWGLSQFKTLQNLDLSQNAVADISEIGYLASTPTAQPLLRALNLSENLVSDINPLLRLTQLSALNLSGNSLIPLIQIQTVVANNTGLTRLGLNNIAIGDLNQLPLSGPNGPYALTELQLHHTGLRDVMGLDQFTSLTALDLGDNRIVDLFALNALQALNDLDLSDNTIVDLSPLNTHTGFNRLILSGNSGIALPQLQTVLANNNGLTRLGLNDIAIGNLGQLPLYGPSGPYALTELQLRHTGISDPTPLAQFTTLQTLDLSENSIVDTIALNPLEALINLDLSANHISALSNFRFPNLQYLDISHNRITRIDSLQFMTNLRTLDISNNTVLQLDALQNLLQLQVLRAANNRLFSLYPLIQHQGLRELDLSNNADLTFIQVQGIITYNPRLTRLGLDGIPIEHFYQLPLYSINGPYALTELSLRNTGMFDLWGLSQFQTLQDLDLSQNALTDLSEIGYLAGATSTQTLRALDLSENPISDINPLLGLTKLSALNLSGNSLIPLTQVRTIVANNTGLTRLGLNDITIFSFGFLPLYGPNSAYALTSLSLRNTGLRGPFGLSGLENFTTLQTLDLGDNYIVDITKLNALQALNDLDLSDNLIVDITPINTYTELRRLVLSGNSGVTLAPLQTVLANNTALEQLALNNIAIGMFSQLPLVGPNGPYALRSLELSHTQLDNMSGIEQFKTLQQLDVSHNSITDLLALQNLSYLRSLDINNNQVDNLSPLQNLTGLSTLRAANNDLFDLSPLAQYLRLNELDLSYNSRLTFTQIYGLLSNNVVQRLRLNGIPINSFGLPFYYETALTELSLSDTGLRDLYGLGRFTNLQKLNLSKNALLDVNELSSLATTSPQKLRALDLSDNELSDINPLLGLHEISALHLSGNGQIPLAQIQSILGANPRLQQLGLSEIKIGDLSLLPLSGPNGPYLLTELQLRDTGLTDITPLHQFPTTLRKLDLAYNGFSNIQSLFGLDKLKRVDLTGDTLVSCTDVYNLETGFTTVVVIRPAGC